MSTPALISEFYRRIWNAGDETALAELLSPEFAFRGSLGVQTRGYAEFWNYVRELREALGDYRCEVLDCVSDDGRAFARMRFSGVHVGLFREYLPTGKRVSWEGAGLFHFSDKIHDLWVLGDLAGLDRTLEENAT